MQRTAILALVLLALASGSQATADTPPQSMSRDALASYIAGRINAALNETSPPATPVCDDTGCDIVVDLQD